MSAPPATFADWADALTAHGVAGFLADVTPCWALVRTAGPIRRDRPTTLEVVLAQPHGYATMLLTFPAGQLTRWHGYRYVGIGASYTVDTQLSEGTPFIDIAADDQLVTRIVPYLQLAAAELTATFAQATWRPQRRCVSYETRTMGRPMTRREACLARRAQELIAVVSRRGRPLEVPIDAVERLVQAMSELGQYQSLDRASLSHTAGLTPEGVDKLRTRALIPRISAAGNLVQTGADQR